MSPKALTSLKIVASLLLIGGSLTYMLSTSMSEEMEFFHPADVVIVKSDELKGQKMRMGGHVLKGSVAQKPGTLEYQFAVQPIKGMLKHPEAAEKFVTVRYTGVVPDTFKDDAEVIVTGTLGHDNVFAARDLIAKCPSKYEAKEKNDGTY